MCYLCVCSLPCLWYPGDLQSQGQGRSWCRTVPSAAAFAVQACHSDSSGSAAAPWSPAHTLSHAEDIHTVYEIAVLQLHTQTWKIHASYLVCVLDLALQALYEAVQLAFCCLFLGAVDHGLSTENNGLPPCHSCFALSQQPLLLLHLLVESHLHRHAYIESVCKH